MDGRSKRREVSRQRVLAAAKDMISANGVDGLAVRELAATAGVSVSTVYNLFDSQDSIIVAVFEEIVDELRLKLGHLADMDDLGQLLANVIEANEIVATEVPAPILLRFSEDLSLLGHIQANDRASKYLRPQLEAALLRGEIRADTDIDVIRMVIDSIVFTASRLGALGVIDAAERSARVRAGVRLVISGVATERGLATLEGRRD